MNLTDQKITLLPQERDGTCQFTGRLVVTRAAHELLGPLVILQALVLVRKQVVEKGGLDRLQVIDVQGRRLWIIDDVSVVTALLPEDY